MGSPICPGTPPGVEQAPSHFAFGHPTKEGEPERRGSVGQRGAGSAQKECNRAQLKLGILQPAIYSPQEGRGPTSNNKSKIPELLSGCEAFQNGRDQYPPGYFAGERLDGKIGPVGRLSDSTHSSQGQEVPEISLEGAVLPIQKPSLWISDSPTHFYEGFATSDVSFAQHGDQVNRVFGRYPGLVAVSRDLEGSHAHCSTCAGVPWFQAQHEQMRVGTDPTYRVPGIFSRLSMKLSLPESKIHQIQKECRSMLGKRIVTPRQLARLIGMLTASIPAVLQAPLHYRALQRLRNRSLRNNRYDQQVEIDVESRQDLLWWIHHFPLHNGRSLSTPVAEVVITSDASTVGWGVTCQSKQAGGPWSREEMRAHINFLELKAAFLALKSFVASKSHMHVLLLMDNITAISFINHKGGTHSKVLSDLALQIWTWCIHRNITVCAEHIPGIDNVGADRESRKKLGLAEWKLNKQLFVKINAKWGPLDVDLFAARHNHQIQRYFSYGPDPEAEAIDALAQNWKNLKPYAFPPFNLLGRCLKKIRQERVKVAVIIAPVWQGQSWYPALLESMIDFPVLLPHSHQLLVSPTGQVHPLVLNSSLWLAAWKVSGDPCILKEFQKKHLTSYPPHGDNQRRSRILQPRKSGWAGVRNGIWIRFQRV